MRLLLTDRFCASARPGTFFDETATGLSLRSLATGKTWSFSFTTPRGKRTQFRLGSYPSMTLAAARALALEARGHLEAGGDPRIAFGQQAAGAMTLAALIGVYLDHPDKLKLRGHAAIKRRLLRNVVPVIGNVTVAELHRRDVQRAIDVILRRGHSPEARRVFEDLHAVTRWALSRGDLDADPMAAMNKPVGSQPRTRTLTAEEIRTLWNGLPKTLVWSKTCQRIIKLCLITGQRVGEVSGMQIGELDRKARTWTIPASRSKNKHAHVLPLSDMAVEIIEDAIADAGGSRFLFPTGDGAIPLSAKNVGKAVIRARDQFGIAPWSMHDLRRTALNGMAVLGVLPHVVGHVANHRGVTNSTITTTHYVHHKYESEVRAALELWAERLAAIVGDTATARIVRLSGAAQ
jgi:integrase